MYVYHVIRSHVYIMCIRSHVYVRVSCDHVAASFEFHSWVLGSINGTDEGTVFPGSSS